LGLAAPAEGLEHEHHAEHDEDERYRRTDDRLDLSTLADLLRLPGDPPLGPGPLELALAIALGRHVRPLPDARNAWFVV
jgi:hypothetical protein